MERIVNPISLEPCRAAVIGFMLTDEPHARAMPSLGVVSRLIQELMPGKWPYVNLFPVRVSADRTGAPVELAPLDDALEEAAHRAATARAAGR